MNETEFSCQHCKAKIYFEVLNKFCRIVSRKKRKIKNTQKTQKNKILRFLRGILFPAPQNKF